MGEKMMPSILFYFSGERYTILYLLANPFQHFISSQINVKKLFWRLKNGKEDFTCKTCCNEILQ